MDWNKAKVLVSGLLPLCPFASWQVLGMALRGQWGGSRGGVWVAFRDIPCGALGQERAKSRPWLRIHAGRVLQMLPCFPLGCGWLLEGWGRPLEQSTCSTLVQDTGIFPWSSFCAGRNNCSCHAAGAGLCEWGGS